MKQLSKIQIFIYRAGGLLILVGCLLWMVKLSFAPYMYCAGAIAFAAMQFMARYEGKSTVVRRLRRQQLLGSFFLLLTGVFIFGNMLHITYMRHNEWIVCLTVAAIFEFYTAFRIPAALKKES